MPGFAFPSNSVTIVPFDPQPGHFEKGAEPGKALEIRVGGKVESGNPPDGFTVMIQIASVKETLKPFPNLAKSGFAGSVRFHVRLFLDFQVATVYRSLREFFAPVRDGKILEVGGGDRPYRHLIKARNVWSLETYHLEKEFGYDSNSVKYDGSHFPFKSGSLDIVFHTEVMEHVYDTRFFLAECNRVLKAGGSMFFTVPFSARFHYKPYDYWRFTPSSLRKLCEEQGFSVSSIRPRGDALVVIMNKIMVFLLGMAIGRQEGTSFRPSRLAFIPMAAVSLPLLGALGQLLLRAGGLDNTDDCLGFSVICVKTGA